MITTWDNYACHPNLHKEHRGGKITILPLEKLVPRRKVIYPSSSSIATMAAPEKEVNSRHTEIWESTIAYKDVFWVDEPGRRTRWDRDFVARQPGIFPMVTRSRRRQLHPMHSKKRNVAVCHHPRAQLQDTKHNYNSQHDRHLRECRLSTTKHKFRQIQISVRRPSHLPPDTTDWMMPRWRKSGGKLFWRDIVSFIEAAPQESPKPT
jgi:hypothetical protein